MIVFSPEQTTIFRLSDCGDFFSSQHEILNMLACCIYILLYGDQENALGQVCNMPNIPKWLMNLFCYWNPFESNTIVERAIVEESLLRQSVTIHANRNAQDPKDNLILRHF